MKRFEDEIQIIEEENGILFSTYKVHEIDLDVAKKIIENGLNFSQGKRMMLFIDGTRTRRSTKPAREFLTSEESFQNVIAAAFYSNNALTSFVLNFIFKVNLKKIMQKTPIKVFSDKEKAITWLETYREFSC